MQIEDKYPELEFIWGVKSADDISGDPCGIDTMNDIEILCDKSNKRYRLGIEIIFQFDNGFKGELMYINRLFDTFTSWHLKGV